MAKNLFDSRSKARKFADENGGKVKDRGAFFDKERWVVEGSEASAPAPGITSRRNNIASRGEARAIAKELDGKVVDNARNKGDHIVRDLEKKGLRWSVEYTERVPIASGKELEVCQKIAESHPVRNKVRDPSKVYPGETGVKVEPETPAPEVDPIVIMTLKNISVTLPDGKQLVMSRDHEDFKAAATLFADGDVAAMVELMDVDKKPREWSFGKDICVIDGKLYHFGMVVPQTNIARRIINDCEAGQDPVKFVNFFRKLMLNPSYKSVQHCYDFIQHNDLEILENGDIRAWKMVTSSGLARNSVPNFKGMTIKMPRNQVEDDPTKTCSHGLHVAAKEYFKHEFGGMTLIEVSLSPENVVSVPTDYNNSKCRSCEYTVLTGLERPDDVPEVLLIDKDGNKLKEIVND